MSFTTHYNGPTSPAGVGGTVDTIVAGQQISVDDTDPANPIVATDGGAGDPLVATVQAGTNITVDDTDKANPIVNADDQGTVDTIQAGQQITVDATDPANPIVGTSPELVETIVGGQAIDVDAIDAANPIVSTPDMTYEATFGTAAQFADLFTINAAWVLSGLLKAKFIGLGACTVGTDVSLGAGVEIVGEGQAVLTLDADINTVPLGPVEDAPYIFDGIQITTDASESKIIVPNAFQRFIFRGLFMGVGTGNSAALFEYTNAGGEATVILEDVDLVDVTGTGGIFNVTSGGILNVFVRMTKDEIGGTTGSYLLKVDSGTGNLNILDGSSIRDFLCTGAGTINVAQDGSSTIDRANVTATTTNFIRMGSASFDGTYTGDGTTSHVIAGGWQFDTRHVTLWKRETVNNVVTQAYETTPQIIDDNASGGAIFQALIRFEVNKVIGLGFGTFTVDDAALDQNPNTDGVVYNYRVEG